MDTSTITHVSLCAGHSSTDKLELNAQAAEDCKSVWSFKSMPCRREFDEYPDDQLEQAV